MMISEAIERLRDGFPLADVVAEFRRTFPPRGNLNAAITELERRRAREGL